ncbi:MAG TPA: Gfo/Idh/MocA family oxidoreductase [Solirubrobacteraceae bacterium]|nr:Gfo/Idh/MocA family oxidoreductase [Solirubrobacteraceae bacterium]
MSRQRRARLGVVGLGVAGRRHAETVACCLSNAELAALVDANEAVVKEFSERYDAPRVNYEQLLADDAIDGIVLATPTPLHPQMIAQAAQAGKHVFCEKPIGLDMQGSVEAVAAAERSGIHLQVGFVRRFDPDWRAAQERIAAGEIGEVYFFRAGQREKIHYDDLSYIDQVGNFFQDVMVHEFDVARWMVGDVVEVSAWGATPTQPELREVGDAQVLCVQLRFANGAIGSLDGTMLSGHGYDCYTEVLGQQGAIRVGYGTRSADAIFLSAGEARTGYPVDFRKRFGAGFIAEVGHFASSILGEVAPAANGRDALASYALAEAATESMRSGNAVTVAPVPGVQA